MPKVEVVDVRNNPAGTVELNDRVFGAPVKGHVIHQAVVMQQACARQGTASTRGRGEVSGSGKKPWRQKHTGRARAGSIRSPIWRHGGTVFGPRPRDYSYRLPKSTYRLAMRGALSAKVADGGMIILDTVDVPEVKTKYLAKALQRLQLANRSVLLVIGEESSHLLRMARNLPRVKATMAEGLNVYDVLRYDRLVVLRDVLPKLEEYWA